jgi:hypothetical protein
MLSQLTKRAPVLVEYDDARGPGASIPERIEALGEWWAARVRAEVARVMTSPRRRAMAKLWGLEGKPASTEEVAAELGIKPRCLHTEMWEVLKQLRANPAIRELHEMQVEN